LFPISGSFGADDNGEKQILLISSYNQYYDNFYGITENLFSHLARSPIPYQITYVNLNTNLPRRSPAGERLTQYEELLKNGFFDIVLTIDDNAYLTLKPYIPALPEATYVIYTALQSSIPTDEAAHRRLTGFKRQFTPLKNIEFALKLCPDAKQFAVITDDNDLGRTLRQLFGQSYPPERKPEMLLFNNSDFPTIDALLARLAKMPPESFVIFTGWNNQYEARPGNTLNLLHRIRESSPGPIFTIRDSFIKFGAAAGLASSGEQLGIDLADYTMQALQNADISSLPPTIVAEVAAVDYNALQRYNIPPEYLPAGTHFFNAPAKLSTANRYRQYLPYILSLLILLAGLALQILWIKSKRRFLMRNDALYGTLPASIVVVDRAGEIKFCRLEANAPQFLRNKKILHISDFTNIDTELLINGIHKVLATGKIFNSYYAYQDRWRKITLSPLSQKAFGKNLVLWLSQDVTELENERRQREKTAIELEKTLYTVGDGVFSTDADGYIQIVNPAAAAIFNTPPDELLGKKANEFFCLLDSGRLHVTDPIAYTIATGKPPVESTSQHFILIAGKRQYKITYTINVLRNNDQQICGVVVAFRDVTAFFAQNAQTAALKQSLDTIAKLSASGYYELKDNGEFSALAQSGNWPMNNGRLLPPLDWVMADDWPEFSRQLNRLWQGEVSEICIKYRSNYYGTLHYYTLTAVLFQADSNTAFAVIQDNTEDEQQKVNRCDAEEILHGTLNALPTPTFTKDLTNGSLYCMCNTAYTTLLGLEPEQIINHSDHELFPNAADTLAANDLAAEQHIQHIFDEWRDMPDGRKKFLRTHKSIITTSGGRKLLLGVSVDAATLEENKQYEHRNNEILQTIFDNLPIGIMAKQPDNDFRYLIWNHAMAEHTGFATAEILGKNDLELDILPGHQQEFHRQDLEIAASGKPFNAVERFINKNGETRIQHIHKMLINTTDNKPLLIGIVENVTEKYDWQDVKRQLIQENQSNSLAFSIVHKIMAIIEHAKPEQPDILNDILAEIAVNITADNAYIFTYQNNYHKANCLAQWNKIAGITRSDSVNMFPITVGGNWYKELAEHKNVIIPDLNSPPDGMECFSEFWQPADLRAIFLLPLFKSGELWGFLGVDFAAEQKNDSNLFTFILQQCSKVIQLAISRHDQLAFMVNLEHFRMQLFDAITIPVMIVRPDYTVAAINSSCRKVFNLSDDKLNRPCCIDVCKSPDKQPPDFCAVCQVLADKLEHSIKIEHNNHVLSITAKPIFDAEHNLIYIVETLTDITELDSHRTQLKTKHHELAVANQMLQNYIEQDRIVKSCLETMVINNDYLVAMQKIIKSVGEYIAADSCAVYMYSEQTQNMRCIEFWPKKHNSLVLKQFDINKITQVFTQLQSGQVINIDLTTADASAEKLLNELKIFTATPNCNQIIACGIWYGKRFWGFFYMSLNQANQYAENITVSAAQIIQVLLERERERKNAKNSEREKWLILNTLDIPLMLHGSDFNLSAVNPAAVKLSGRSERDVIEMRCCNVFCQCETPPANCPVTLTLQDLQPHKQEMDILNRRYQVTTQPIFGDGKLANILETFVDITEINESRRQQQAAMEAAQAASQAKSFFLSTMSHEIRTPLNAVIGFSDLLKKELLPETERNEYLTNINQAGQNLLQLINDVLDLSKIEADQLELIPVELDIPELCNEINDLFRLRAEERNLALNIKFPPDMPHILMDKLRLRQVLLNMVGNAIKFTDHGSAMLEIHFDRNDNHTGILTIHIIDTGRGIAPQDRERIFEPFIQVDAEKGTHSTNNGTGLGLAIALRLIQKMGGKLNLESELERGSRFTISFHNVRFITPPPNTHSARIKQQKEFDLNQVKILLVDDLPMNIAVLNAILKRCGAAVKTAASGRQALDMLRDFQPQIILTDLWMPEMNGAEFAAAVWAQPEFAAVPIVAVTADTDCRNNFDLSHFSAVLNKPITHQQLQILTELL